MTLNFHWNICKQMKNFYEFYKLADEKVQRSVALLPWRHNIVSFISIEKPLKERELEKRLVEKIKYFLLELGTGFSFIGNQYRLTRNEKEYFVDMLFFNRK